MNQQTSPSTPSIPALPPLADYHQVDVEGFAVGEVQTLVENTSASRSQILDKLQLADCLKGCDLTDHQVNKALIAIIACALFTASGHKTSQILSTHSSLQSLYNHPGFISHKALYAVSDRQYAHQETIDNFLDRRLTGVFNLEDKLVIFDISSTYFETRCRWDLVHSSI